jgi:hypothetical protein
MECIQVYIPISHHISCASTAIMTIMRLQITLICECVDFAFHSGEVILCPFGLWLEHYLVVR